MSAPHRLPTASRLQWVDYARGIGIILVVAGHTLDGLKGAGLAMSALANEFVAFAYSFHMPLFFLLAGLFAEKSFARGFRSFTIGKLTTVLYPFLLWSVIQILFRGTLSQYTNKHVSTISALKLILVFPLGQMWFLYVLLWMFLFFALMRQCGLRSNGIMAVAIAALIVSPFISQPLVHKLFFNFIYFALGLSLREKLSLWLESAQPSSLSLFFTTVFSLHLWLLFAISPQWDPYGLVISGLLACLGIAGVCATSQLLAQKTWMRWLVVLGRYSLPIFLMHTIFGSGIRIVLQRLLHLDDPWILAIFGLVNGIVWPLLIGIATQKMRWNWLLEWPRFRTPRSIREAV